MNINQYSISKDIISKDIIFCVINKDSVEKLLEQKFYSPASLENEGFIHFSKKEQVSWVIETFYSNKEELCVLGVETKKLTAILKYEDASVNIETDSVPPEKTHFPHLYGALNVDAIVNVIDASAFFEQEMDTQVSKMIELYAFDRLPVEGTFYKSTYTSSGRRHNGGRYALFGCTMAPGFHPEDFEAGNVDILRKQYPDRLLDILRFNVNGKHTKMSL